MEKITKENLWNNLKYDYPEMMDKFCAWIDEYKKENNWTALFTGDSDPKAPSYPKFHDLPAGMQLGIFTQFAQEQTGKPLKIASSVEWTIRDWFALHGGTRNNSGNPRTNEVPPMTDPLGKHWEQPAPGEVIIDDDYAVVETGAFSKLHDYSNSQPTGVYPGKMWYTQTKTGRYLRWFGEFSDETKTEVLHHVRKLLVVERDAFKYYQFLRDKFIQMNDDSAGAMNLLLASNEKLRETIATFDKLINTPEIEDFYKGFKFEAAHQVSRWGPQTHVIPEHFILIAAKLLGKMSVDLLDVDASKLKHHIIAMASVMHNFHRVIMDQTSAAHTCLFGTVQGDQAVSKGETVLLKITDGNVGQP